MFLFFKSSKRVVRFKKTFFLKTKRSFIEKKENSTRNDHSWKRFKTCCVPKLDSYISIINSYRLHLEINTFIENIIIKVFMIWKLELKWLLLFLQNGGKEQKKTGVLSYCLSEVIYRKFDGKSCHRYSDNQKQGDDWRLGFKKNFNCR